MNLPDKWLSPNGVARLDYRDRCHLECTAGVIFLLQRLVYAFLGPPPGFVYDYETDVIHAEDDIERTLELKDMTHMEQACGLPCVMENWEVDSVWLSREEASEFATRTSYNFTSGWRVYGVCSKGELSKLLKLT